MCTKLLWNVDRIIPLVYSSLRSPLSVKCRRIHSVGKTLGEYFLYFFIRIILNIFLKKLFRIHNIKLYKLIVKKPIMEIKFLLNIKK
jgi:hypothetical protein